MFLAKVEGAVVATKKDPSMNGRKLLLLRPQLVDEKDPTRFRPGLNTIVAVDSVGAGIGEMVLFCQGSSARLAPNLKDAPVDAVIIGIVDVVDVLGKMIYNAQTINAEIRSRIRSFLDDMSAINETLIRDVVAEVMGRLDGSPAPATPAPAPAAPAPAPGCGCDAKASRGRPPPCAASSVFFRTPTKPVPPPRRLICN